MVSRYIIALGLLAFCAGVTSAVDPCTPALNFFPTANEIGEPQLVNNKTCKGDAVCNFPSVWAEANQTKYMTKLDTNIDNGILSVAFKQYGNEKPRLFFAPVSGFLSAGADVSACAESRLEGPPATRKLLAESYTVETAGTWTYTVSYDGAPAVPGLKIAGKSGQLDPVQLAKDGHHCATVTVTVDGAEVTPAIPGLPSRLTGSQTVCWYKISTQATATFDFDMCTSKLFTVNVSNIAPLPQNLTQNGTDVLVKEKQAMLFRPVIHLFGRKNRTLDGTVIQDLEYDNMNNPINFINKYIVLPANVTADETLSFVLDEDQLDEGYYKLSAKVALISQFPDLIDLEGENAIVQADSYGEDVRGNTEYSGVTIVNETSMVGVQKSKTTISQITSDKINKYIQSGDSITFFWRFAGIGSEKCYHDDVEIPGCMSGLIVPAKDVSHEDTQHTFRVVFTDVCGNTKEAEYSYTQAGVKTISKVDYIPVTTDDMQLRAPATRHTQNSAATAGPAGFLATLGMGLLSFLLMAAML